MIKIIYSLVFIRVRIYNNINSKLQNYISKLNSNKLYNYEK